MDGVGGGWNSQKSRKARQKAEFMLSLKKKVIHEDTGVDEMFEVHTVTTRESWNYGKSRS